MATGISLDSIGAALIECTPDKTSAMQLILLSSYFPVYELHVCVVSMYNCN